jgi:predicted Zn-dependent peptidase
VYGQSADLSKLTLADAQEFYRQHFGPANAVVTVVGRFDPEQARTLARKYFEPLRATGGRAPALPPMDKPQPAERRAIDNAGSPLRALLAAWRLPPRTDPRWPALDVLSFVLVRGTSSRLSKALVYERRLCASVQGELDSHKDESLFYVSAPLLQNADTAEVERRLFGEIGRLSAETVSNDELEKAKRQIETATWLGLQNSRGRAQVIGYSVMLSGNDQDFARQLERIRAVTPNDVLEAARLLDPARREVLWIVPGPGAGGRP